MSWCSGDRKRCAHGCCSREANVQASRITTTGARTNGLWGPEHRAISRTTITAYKSRLPNMEPLINCLFIVSIFGSMTPFVNFFTNVYLHLNSKCSFLRLQKPPEDVDSETRPCADIPLWTPKTVVLACCCEQRDNTESPCCLGQLLEWRWGGGVAFPNNITLEDQLTSQ